LWALAFLITAFQLSPPCACFHQAVTYEVLRSCNTSSSHLNFCLLFLLLSSVWEMVNFLQSEFSSNLLICPSLFSGMVFIDQAIFAFFE
jgi:hypothetical protein